MTVRPSSCTGPFCGDTTHTYTTAGTFTAVLTVVDTGGASATSNEIIVDLETSSVASFTMAPSTRAGVPLPAGWITNTSADPDGGPLTAAWTFQNGTPPTSSSWNPPSVTFTHNVADDDDTFVSADYKVALTATDSSGVRHVASRRITVTGAPAPGNLRTTGSGCLNPASCDDGRFIRFAWDAVPNSSVFEIRLDCTTPGCAESLTQTISGSATSYVFGGLAGGPASRSYDARIRTQDSVTGKFGAWSDPPIAVSS